MLHHLIVLLTVFTGVLLTCTLAMGPMLLDHEDDRGRSIPLVPVDRERPRR